MDGEAASALELLSTAVNDAEHPSSASTVSTQARAATSVRFIVTLSLHEAITQLRTA
jgi:hypothetical protein